MTLHNKITLSLEEFWDAWDKVEMQVGSAPKHMRYMMQEALGLFDVNTSTPVGEHDATTVSES